MQIDFHHTVTYVIARLAGMVHEHAEIVAYSAQYVDDATNEGEITFDNGAIYRRLSSAHKMLDYRNLDSLKNHLVWIPFHFLPGNGGLPAGQNPMASYYNKLVCKPNSYVAQDMVRLCILDKAKPHALHRLGITAHVFEDTYAHQQFAGVDDKVNEVHNLKWVNDKVERDDPTFFKRIKKFFGGLAQDKIPTLGHGQALSYPDRPYVIWTYTNGEGEKVIRNNPKDFVEAAHELCKIFQRFLAGAPDANVPGLSDLRCDQIKEMVQALTYPKGDKRHKLWLDAVKNDEFGFGAVELDYIPKGEGSWKYAALGTQAAVGDEDEYRYDPRFLASNWRLFHDAAKAHRFEVINDILPRYEILAA